MQSPRQIMMNEIKFSAQYKYTKTLTTFIVWID